MIQLHTMTIHKTIKMKEAEAFCNKYQINLTRETGKPVVIDLVHIPGITKVRIEYRLAKIDGKPVPKYDMYITINVGKMAGKSGLLMMTWDDTNRAQFISRLRKALADELCIITNSDPTEWYIDRVDFGIDIFVNRYSSIPVKLYIYIIRQEYMKNEIKGLRVGVFKNQFGYDTNDQSLYLKDVKGKFIYNIYDKQQQEKNINASEFDIRDTKDILRVEYQVLDFGGIFRKGKRLKMLFDENVLKKMQGRFEKDIASILSDDINAVLFLNSFFDPATNMFDQNPVATPYQLFTKAMGALEAKNKKCRFGSLGVSREEDRKPRIRIQFIVKNIYGESRRFKLWQRKNEKRQDFEARVLDKLVNIFEGDLLNATSDDERRGVRKILCQRLDDFEHDFSDNNSEVAMRISEIRTMIKES